MQNDPIRAAGEAVPAVSRRAFLRTTASAGLATAAAGSIAVMALKLAARLLLDLPGKIAAKDAAHAAELDRLMRSAFDGNRVLVPRGRKAAA